MDAKWDEDAARKAVEEFHSLLRELEGAHGECVGRLRDAWEGCYGRCGHKRLGRIMLGRTPEEACRVRVSRGEIEHSGAPHR